MSLRLPADVCAVDTNDALVLLDQRTGRYFQLNSSGAEVLRALLAGDTTEAAAERLRRGYGVSVERAAADVTGLLASLRSAGLVTG
jgi:hypothetical protein